VSVEEGNDALDGRRFREFFEDVLEGINLPPDERIDRITKLFDYLLVQVHDHLNHPRENRPNSAPPISPSSPTSPATSLSRSGGRSRGGITTATGFGGRLVR
jgi:hypothetical protein